MSFNSMMSLKLLSPLMISLLFNPIDSKPTIFENKDMKNENNFCQQNSFEMAYSDHKNRTIFANNDWIWIYDQNTNKMLAPIKKDTNEKFQLKSIAFISSVPNCQTSSVCADIKRAEKLLIMLFKKPNTDFAGAYQVRKQVNGMATKVQDSTSLPFGLKVTGNMFSTEETFWPKNITENGNHLKKKHTIIVFNRLTNELLVLVNGDDRGLLCFNILDSSLNTWTENWKCQTISNEWKFVGAVVLKNNIYVLTVKDSKNLLFTISKKHELIETSISIQSYFGCGLKGQIFMAKDPDVEDMKSGGTSFWIWIFVIISTVVCLIAVFALISIVAIRRTPSKEKVNPENKSKEKDRQPVPTGKMLDDKGAEVNQSKIGVLDSNVNWDIVIETPSKDSIEGQNMTPNPEPKGKKKKT